MQFTLLLMIVMGGHLQVTVTPKMTKFACEAVKTKAQSISGTDGIRVYSWCVQTSSETVEGQ